jgi:hypothetical protein
MTIAWRPESRMFLGFDVAVDHAVPMRMANASRSHEKAAASGTGNSPVRESRYPERLALHEGHDLVVRNPSASPSRAGEDVGC